MFVVDDGLLQLAYCFFEIIYSTVIQAMHPFPLNR
jgi:hypothetical protein